MGGERAQRTSRSCACKDREVGGREYGIRIKYGGKRPTTETHDIPGLPRCIDEENGPLKSQKRKKKKKQVFCGMKHEGWHFLGRRMCKESAEKRDLSQDEVHRSSMGRAKEEKRDRANTGNSLQYCGWVVSWGEKEEF